MQVAAPAAALQQVEASLLFEHVLLLQSIVPGLTFKPFAPFSAQNVLIADVPDMVLHLAALAQALTTKTARKTTRVNIPTLSFFVC